MKFIPACSFVLVFLVSCMVPPQRRSHVEDSHPFAVENPAKKFVLLDGAADGWRASLVLDNDPVGIWRMEPLQFFPQYATPEVIGLDDHGSCWIMVNYSGKWTPTRLLNDGVWLGALDFADVDPTAPGKELYVGGKRGVLYQVRSYHDGLADARRIATFDGREVHTIVAGPIREGSAEPEILVFTRPGALYRVTPQSNGTFATEFLGELAGRIRVARVLPDGKTIVTAGRDGKISLLRMTAAGPQWEVIHGLDSGRGRLALGEVQASGMPLIYSTGDAGRVFRHELVADGHWQTTTIYSGPLGPRGLVAGHFLPNHNIETVAVFGYSGRVELLQREGDQWSASTLFEDRDRGHWLSKIEIDGRNNTDEILLSGYGARMVLLSANPGTGIDELSVPVDLDKHTSGI
jgi:hypothetical protein